MIHEHDALELASAALDFPLSPAEARELELELADCEICAERAAAYRVQRRLMTQLPAFEVSDVARRRITRAAAAGRVDSRPPMLLLVAALLLAMLLAVAVGAGALLNRQRSPDLALAEPSLSPSPAASVEPSLAIDTPAPVASDSPRVSSPGDFAKDTIVAVVSDDVRVRSAPRVADDSIRFEPLLRIGDRLFVVQGPVIANDYEWYEVRPVGIDGKRPWTTLPSGWIARGDHDGTPWVAIDQPRCPAEPVEIGTLAAMHPLERLTCFGSRPLAFRTVVQRDGAPVACDPAVTDGPCVAGPDWLAGVGGWSAGSSVHRDTGTTTSGPALAIDPAGGVGPADLPDGRVAFIEGSFDHPAAAACSSGAAPQGEAALSSEQARLECRARFVVTDAEPAPNVLVPGTAAVTVSDNVRVRSLPVVSEQSARLTPLLDTGTGVFVLDGPSLGSGYDWYEVVVPSIPDGEGLLVGWVSVASKTDEAWVATANVDCPSLEGVELADLAALIGVADKDRGLACFGGRGGGAPTPLRFEADVMLACDESTPRTVPAWLAAEGASMQLSDGRQAFKAKAHLDLTVPLDCSGGGMGRYVVEGRFDDEDAATCQANPAISGGIPIDERVAVYRCRIRFVVTTLTPVAP